jgi:hypothetical protein
VESSVKTERDQVLICKCKCVDMEGTLLTVEETVESAPVSTPTPRRRAPRPRASAKPDTEISADSGAMPEAIQASESTPDGSTAQAEVTSEYSREAVVNVEPQAAVNVEPEAVRPVDLAPIP